MAEMTTPSTEPVALDPVRASMLLDLEKGKFQDQESPAVQGPLPRGIWVPGLDRRLAPLWSGGKVLGIGTADENRATFEKDKTCLSTHILASALLKNLVGSQILRPLPTETPSARAPLTVYIVAPHTFQTVPLLHVLLANRLSDSHAAIELLRGVHLLQYFDLPGLVESLGEVGEGIYRRGEQERDSEGQKSGNAIQLTDLVLIQGIGPTVSAAHRRSGLAQANALLAALMRNITQLSRTSKNASVLVDVAVEVDAVSGQSMDQDPSKPRRFAMGMELDSAFSSPAIRSLRLVCGNETLSRTLEAAFDCTVLVHDGLGRIEDLKKRGMPGPDFVVEVTKDRTGDMMGFWATWNTEQQGQS